MNDPSRAGSSCLSDVAIIGGGASGMMAAIAAAKNGASVTVYEQNEVLGKKLRITGKGRCNVTNDCSPAEILDHVVKNPKFLTGAVFRFSPADVMRFFEEECSVPLKTERGRRVFPISDHASDISRALEKKMRDLNVQIQHKKATGLLLSPEGCCRGVRFSSDSAFHKAVIVATGGVSYPGTGSRGDGYRFAQQVGLRVATPLPSLVPIVTKEDTSPMSGLSLKNVKLTVKQNGRPVFEEMGEMLFTHFGVSGPLVLSASAHMRGDMCSYTMEIDMKPALNEDTLDTRLISDLTKYAARDFLHALDDLLPQSMIAPVIAASGIPPHIKAGAVTRKMRVSLSGVLKHFPLTPIRFRPVEEAIITSGGVETNQIHTKTMMSKTTPGLFFAGEVIDVDAYTGGYNLQIAFSTGFAAGRGAAEFAAEQACF